MMHEEKKIGKIIEELTMYFFALGADQIESGIHREGCQVTVTFRSNYDLALRHRLDRLEEYLNEPKNEGIEDFYWELAGTGDPGESNQLLLVGMMVDSAEVEVGEDTVSLRLTKRLNE